MTGRNTTAIVFGAVVAGVGVSILIGGYRQEGCLASTSRRSRLAAIGAIVVLAVFAASCNPLGEDWKLGPTSIGYEHHGSTIQIEPGDELSIGLRANGLFPEATWQIRAIDTAMLEPTGQGHETEVRAPGDYQGGEGSPKPWPFIPSTFFDFVGRAQGVSQLVFDVQVEGRLVDVYEVTVAVMGDACDGKGAAGIVTPMRCERKPPVGDEPAGLTYDQYGWAVRLEPRGEFTAELRANARYPDIAWQVAEIHPAVVDVQSVVHDTDPQASAEHSRWPPTIFPETRLSFIGRALGESPLVLEMRDGDEQLDIYELTVFVVEDACDMGPDPWNIFTPHPCEMAPPRY